MTDEFLSSQPSPDSENENPITEIEQETPPARRHSWAQLWERLLRLGLGEVTLRFGTGLASIILVLVVVWVMDSFYLKGDVTGYRSESALAAPLPTPTAMIDPPPLQIPDNVSSVQGITRLAQIHTTLPTKPRQVVTQYKVQKGDTIFAIAAKFNLRPETILWGNYYTLADDPHRLSPGQTLNILPVDGVYYEWHAGDGLNGVAQFYGVTPEDIINFSGNNLSVDTIGEYSHPNIAPGTWLVIPGGYREFVTWSAPRITRSNPGVAKILGPGACGTVMDGPVGNGTFIWPANNHYLSGYDYSPETNLYGIYIACNEGEAVFAVDNGVVVYAGWNDWGYGNVVVIDHGNGWQSLYAHMSSYNVSCASYVYQGDIIGTIGSTGNSSGPHLHFELRSDTYGKANPWNFLPPP